MQQHPVPQNITGFEFKLVGFLTLKQFLYLAGPGIVSFIIFVATTSILKWLFITPIVLLGLALAFLPILGMSFDRWVVVFIRAITSPARRIWYKEPKIISFLAPEFSYYLRRSLSAKPVPVADRSRLQTFVSQIRSSKESDRLDIFERSQLASLGLGKIEQASPTAPAPGPVQDRGAALESGSAWSLAETTAPEIAPGTMAEQARPLKLKRRSTKWRTRHQPKVP
jgi:hypothetical protein